MEEQAQTRARHILMQASEIRTENETKSEIDSVYSALQDGGDFEALAKEYSEDPGSALKGGDLGLVYFIRLCACLCRHGGLR